MIKIPEFVCWTITENQREGREGWSTHSKNTLLHYHKVDFVLSTKALFMYFLKILSCDVLFFERD